MDFSSLAQQLPATKQPRKPTNFGDINFILDLYTIKDLRLIAEKLELNRLFGKRAQSGEDINITRLTKKELIDEIIETRKAKSSGPQFTIEDLNKFPLENLQEIVKKNRQAGKIEFLGITQLTKKELIAEIAKYYSVEWKKAGEQSSGEQINNNDLFNRFSLEDLRELVKLIGQSGTIKVKGVKRDELEKTLKPLINFYLIPNEENISQKKQLVDKIIDEQMNDETTSIDKETRDIIKNYITDDVAQYSEKISKASIISEIKAIFLNTLDELESRNTRNAISGELPEILLNKFNQTYEELLPIQADKQKRISQEKQTYEAITEKLAMAETKRYMRAIFRELPDMIDIKELRQVKLENKTGTEGNLLKLGGKQLAIGAREKPVKKDTTEQKQPRGRPKVDKKFEIPVETVKRAYKKKADKQLDISTYDNLIDELSKVERMYKRGELMKIKIKEPTKQPKFYQTLNDFQTIYMNAIKDKSNIEMRQQLYDNFNDIFIMANREEDELEKVSAGQIKATKKEMPLDSIINYLDNIIKLYGEIPGMQKEEAQKKELEKLKKKSSKRKTTSEEGAAASN